VFEVKGEIEKNDAGPADSVSPREKRAGRKGTLLGIGRGMSDRPGKHSARKKKQGEPVCPGIPLYQQIVWLKKLGTGFSVGKRHATRKNEEGTRKKGKFMERRTGTLVNHLWSGRKESRGDQR